MHLKLIKHRCASTVKWRTLVPCSGLSESVPKLYTNFEFYTIEIHKHLENIWTYKAKQFMFTKNNVKQLIFILEDGASGEKVGDIEKMIVKNLFRKSSHYIHLINIWKKITMTSSLQWIQGIKKNLSSKYLRSWNLHSKLDLVNCFYASLWMIGFEDLISIV